jgi:hypothetical protein
MQGAVLRNARGPFSRTFVVHLDLAWICLWGCLRTRQPFLIIIQVLLERAFPFLLPWCNISVPQIESRKDPDFPTTGNQTRLLHISQHYLYDDRSFERRWPRIGNLRSVDKTIREDRRVGVRYKSI